MGSIDSKITAISSMATRELLAELVESYRQVTGTVVAIESVGGVDAARRVRAGEPVDIVVLAEDAIAALEDEGVVVRETRVAIAASSVAVAVRAGAPLPDIGSEAAVRAAILQAASIGYSTGPSGIHLARLFERWGIVPAIAARLVQPPPGTPIARLVASGQVEIGFQQLSELIHAPGIHVVGILPPEIAIVTEFSGGICATSKRTEEARAWLAFTASREAEAAKHRHGMQPVR